MVHFPFYRKNNNDFCFYRKKHPVHPVCSHIRIDT